MNGSSFIPINSINKIINWLEEESERCETAAGGELLSEIKCRIEHGHSIFCSGIEDLSVVVDRAVRRERNM